MDIGTANRLSLNHARYDNEMKPALFRFQSSSRTVSTIYPQVRGVTEELTVEDRKYCSASALALGKTTVKWSARSLCVRPT